MEVSMTGGMDYFQNHRPVLFCVFFPLPYSPALFMKELPYLAPDSLVTWRISLNLLNLEVYVFYIFQVNSEIMSRKTRVSKEALKYVQVKA